MQLDEAGFRALFAGSPVKRLGHARFLRNVLIALGNSGMPQLGHLAERQISNPEPLIRGAAIWAMRRLSDQQHAEQLKLAFLPAETDMGVRAEWTAEVPAALLG